MKNVVALFMICFFPFISRALNVDFKIAFAADKLKVRGSSGNIIVQAPQLVSENGKDLYCEGSFVTLTVTGRVNGGSATYEWYLGKDLIEKTTSNQLKVNKAGQYQVTINGGMKTNTLIITMLPKPAKPSVIYL